MYCMYVSFYVCMYCMYGQIWCAGDGQLKYYAVSGDSLIKTGNLLQAAKESYEKFIDHIWLPSNSGLHKMVLHSFTLSSMHPYISMYVCVRLRWPMSILFQAMLLTRTGTTSDPKLRF